MSKIKSFLLLIAVALCSFQLVSCSKSSDELPPTPTIKAEQLNGTWQHTAENWIVNIKFDNQNATIHWQRKQENTAPTPDENYSVSLNSNHLTLKEKDTNASMTYEVSFTNENKSITLKRINYKGNRYNDKENEALHRLHELSGKTFTRN
ncbi:hypothetical protein HMPREF0647_00910 [Prevotella bivia DNF00320]|uniref:Lipocalin-like domain-containing protein n=1 Tax=Prevotella bivia DNF00320 TaxID=1401068 RepID=A0A096BSN2_9BACT|nr:hypothetical protein [Prevotella bivia]KGF45702.1 hypothetical protein HMPREF0647_00910 [Prevotella bivia DNF00320]